MILACRWVQKLSIMAEKPRFRRRTVFAKNLGFGVSFGYRNNTIDVEVNFTRCGNLTPRFLQRCSTNRRCMIVSWLSAWTSGSTRYSRRYQRGCLPDSRVLASASELVDCLCSTLLRSPVSRPAYLLTCLMHSESFSINDDWFVVEWKILFSLIMAS